MCQQSKGCQTVQELGKKLVALMTPASHVESGKMIMTGELYSSWQLGLAAGVAWLGSTSI